MKYQINETASMRLQVEDWCDIKGSTELLVCYGLGHSYYSKVTQINSIHFIVPHQDAEA